jgi:hypothetical protein
MHAGQHAARGHHFAFGFAPQASTRAFALHLSHAMDSGASLRDLCCALRRVEESSITETNMIQLVLFGIQNRTLHPIWQPMIGSSFRYCRASLLWDRCPRQLHLDLKFYLADRGLAGVRDGRRRAHARRAAPVHPPIG